MISIHEDRIVYKYFGIICKIVHMATQAKIVMLGDSGTGKSSILERLIRNRFNPRNRPTQVTGMNTFVMKIEGRSSPIKFQIWDTAGQEKYHSMASFYYKDAVAAVVVLDITNLSSFDGAKRWIEELKNARGEDINIILVGNKSDLIEDQKINIKDAKLYADEIGATFFSSSAKDNINIREIFEEVGMLIVEGKKLSAKDTTSSSHTKNDSNSNRRVTLKESKTKNELKPCCQ